MKPINLRDAEARRLLDTGRCEVVRAMKMQPQVTSAGGDAAWRDGRADLWRNRRQYARDCCPLGSVGDVRWARETHMAESRNTVHYKADGWGYSDCPNSGWRSAPFMPRWASRLTVRIAAVAAEQRGGSWCWVVLLERVADAEVRS